MANSSANNDDAEPSSLHTFSIRTQDTQFALREHENLLDALERTGHDVVYQCRGGYCGTCRLTLLSGKVSYAEPPMAFLHPNEILPCCCQVQSDLQLVCRQRDAGNNHE